MPQGNVSFVGPTAYREAPPAEAGGKTPVLCIHGWPQSSYLWRHLLPSLAADGRRAVAPDLAGFGDSPPDPPGTVERQLEALERFHLEMELGPVVLVVHDTGGIIGLRWACDHPESVAGLVITNTGFFPDHDWTEVAITMRTPGQGEALLDSLSREAFTKLLAEAATGFDDAAFDEYWKAFTTPEGRRGMLELYRSFKPEQLAGYEEKLAALGVPTLVLFGRQDQFIPDDYSHRFARQIPDSRLVLLDGVGHFLFEDAPERCAEEVLAFLRQSGL